MKGTRGGTLIDPDLIKNLDPIFRTDTSKYARAVHEPSSALSKQLMTEALQKKAAAGDESPTVFTAGGSGSGKGATLPLALAASGAKPDALTFDSVLGNKDRAIKKIDEVLNTTKGKVLIAYTNTDPAQAFSENLKRERSVMADTFTAAHVGASNALHALAEHYKDNPRVEINVMNNHGKEGGIYAGTLEDVPKHTKESVRAKLQSVAKKHVEDHPEHAEKVARVMSAKEH
jgi:hypothetical protein